MTDKYPGKQTVLKKTVSIEQKRGMIKIYPPPARMSSQSVMLPGPERIRASGATINPEQYVQFPDDKTHTVCDTVLTGLLKSSCRKKRLYWIWIVTVRHSSFEASYGRNLYKDKTRAIVFFCFAVCLGDAGLFSLFNGPGSSIP
ncbi:long-chain-fatty-acid--CoA ligase 1 [Trichonephila inaurata madagascariensis]|uniref:Long-chain-fatty-acid--CoA ligase 1 n=1 Tax=Trichonephila inaurata madagascariensis TaxID=2747483 RepID=A0A8X7CJC2_9ARAC|nr:long-chain-fatty-acid--CoA ligase 1 [Trichonephila inaurata madagascariensis]